MTDKETMTLEQVVMIDFIHQACDGDKDSKSRHCSIKKVEEAYEHLKEKYDF